MRQAFGELGRRTAPTAPVAYAGRGGSIPEVFSLGFLTTHTRQPWPPSSPHGHTAIKSARAYGTVVSVDLNYRPSLWADHGGQERAGKVFTQLAEAADVVIGGETDFLDRLGIEPPSDSLQGEARFSFIASRTLARFPNIDLVATTARRVSTASRNDWQGMCHTLATGTVTSRERKDLEILDRVGGGDGFASGLIYGLLQGLTVQEAVDIGAAHGALAMTTPGDNSMATLPEVLAAAQGIGSSTHR